MAKPLIRWFYIFDIVANCCSGLHRRYIEIYLPDFAIASDDDAGLDDEEIAMLMLIRDQPMARSERFSWLMVGEELSALSSYSYTVQGVYSHDR